MKCGGGFQFHSLRYQHPDADAKTAQTAETIRRWWETWKSVTLLAATVAGGTLRPVAKGWVWAMGVYDTAGK